jgi:hypothetical protein
VLLLHSVSLPLLAAVVGIVVHQQIVPAIKGMPSRVVRRLQLRLRLVVWLAICCVPIGPTLTLAASNPYHTLAVYTYANVALTALSATQIAAFRPVAVRIPRGPLWTLLGWLWGLVVGVRHASPLASRFGNVRQRREALVRSAETIMSQRRLSGGISPHLMLGMSIQFLRNFAKAHGVDESTPSVRIAQIARELTVLSRRSLA